MGIHRYRMAFIGIITVAICVMGFSWCDAQENGGVASQAVAAQALSLPSISLFRYSSVGLGAYPYLSFAPGIPLKVTLEGVPFRAISPFGPDIDLLPVQFADSLSWRGVRELAAATPGITNGEPVTDTRFLLGNRRRFSMGLSFNRRTAENAGIVVAGTSSGIHGGDSLEKSSARSYLIKYRRELPRTGAVVVWSHAMRDRDGLMNLTSGSNMGERRTDGLTTTAGLVDYSLTERTVLSSTLFYQMVNTRIGRYGSRRSLDDDTVGFRLNVRGGELKTGYHIGLSHDIRMFDSRLHDESWTRRETGIEGGVRFAAGRYSFLLTAGETYSSEYGAGLMIRAEAERGIGGVIVRARMLHEDVIPDTGTEYYSALVFTDSTIAAHPEKYHIDSVETSVRVADTVELGLFFSRYERPASEIIVSAIQGGYADRGDYLADDIDLAGVRMSFDYRVSRRFIYDISGAAEYRGVPGASSRELWPFPEAAVSLITRVSGDFIGGRLYASCYQESRFQSYEAPDGLTPHGGYYTLDAGLTFRVRTVELFYRMENITSEDIRWFDAFGSLNRNGMWGVRWLFYD